MTTITKERIELFIKNPLENGLTRGEQMELARIAMASLEAEPIGAFHIADQQVGGTSDYIKDGEWPIDNGVIDVYAVPPVLVVPEERPSLNNGIVGFDEGWNACRAAMLYGAVPASQAYKLPQTQFKQVADLYEMQFDDGRTCTFHTDAQKAAQWLQACDGNRVQEYVKLERLQNALSSNSPVTPDGWISCSERMPVIGELNWRTSFPLLVTCEFGVIPAYYGFVRVNGNKHYGFMESLKYGDDSGNHPQTNEYGMISNVTHWMPLPEPPKEVK
ncbi:TPA: DUF551 domain-containing protein [Salmonella enterica]|uniref:DUF551 domain-containing protein n=1 Tax=Salmonella enterica TaxID=28901 RepID=A0A750BMA2_SALER|nr:DUF551 domain-containing protein [Salmonella enterica]HAF6139511.1 DUF551 domain-containing protein [Salmonella enterica]